MRAGALLLGLWLLVGCAAAEQSVAADPPAASEVEAQPLTPPPPPAPQAATLECAGAFTQGGIALCRSAPGAEIFIGEERVTTADAEGWAVIGFTRESPAEVLVSARGTNAAFAQTLQIAPREFDVQRIDGLPQQTVTPSEPAVIARIQRESALKQTAFASEAPLEGFLDGFIWPVDGRISGRWGNQRILNGTPSTPHFGVDIAAPTGTPIRAPAAGVVTLAEADMHYEGGLVFIDHGQGLITMYLHMSRLDVAVGQQVAQGDVIGTVGASGRATGPHLCWRMRWRARQLDPTIAIDGLTQARTQLSN